MKIVKTTLYLTMIVSEHVGIFNSMIFNYSEELKHDDLFDYILSRSCFIPLTIFSFLLSLSCFTLTSPKMGLTEFKTCFKAVQKRLIDAGVGITGVILNGSAASHCIAQGE